jgi:predicted NAD/FAD-binding protein
MGGAIWSTPVIDMLNFPAKTFIRFFDNHGLLTVNDQPQWHTVVGGSCEYVKRLSHSFYDKIKIGCGVVRVVRHADSVDIYDMMGELHSYDKVIFACHSDQALNMLDNPTQTEQDIIGKIKYQNNKMILHKDINFMPKRKSAWASWIYLKKQTQTNHSALALSYWMNNLQPLNTKTPIIVTLNPTISPDKSMIYDEYNFEHPVFDADAIDAQSKIPDIQGQNNTYYTGAWQRYGFHEDGLLSAVNVAKLMGIDVPWQVQVL